MTQFEIMSGMLKTIDNAALIARVMANVPLDLPSQQTLAFTLKDLLGLAELFRDQWQSQLVFDGSMSGNISKFAAIGMTK